MEKVPIREYARRHGVSDTTIHKKINKGKIVNGVVYEEVNGKKTPFIVVDIADKEWASTRNPNYVRVTRAEKATGAPMGQVAEGLTASENPNVQKARIQTALLALELAEKQGQLVRKDAVNNALFAMGKQIRERFQALPVRVTNDMMASESHHEAQQILATAIADILEELSTITKLDI